jgi:RNA polymerase sigma factor (sigma-70 family)
MACATSIAPRAPSWRDPEDQQAARAADFQRLLAWLDGGVESRGERYLEIRRRLVGYFDRRNRLFAEDLADETFNRIASILARDGAIAAPPERYCYVVARFVLLEDFRRERRDNLDHTADLEEQRAANTAALDDESDREERLDLLDDCLQDLTPEQRDLIVDYYRETGGSKIVRRRETAKRLGITSNALAIRASRIRRTLEARMAALRRLPD